MIRGTRTAKGRGRAADCVRTLLSFFLDPTSSLSTPHLTFFLLLLSLSLPTLFNFLPLHPLWVQGASNVCKSRPSLLDCSIAVAEHFRGASHPRLRRRRRHGSAVLLLLRGRSLSYRLTHRYQSRPYVRGVAPSTHTNAGSGSLWLAAPAHSPPPTHPPSPDLSTQSPSPFVKPSSSFQPPYHRGFLKGQASRRSDGEVRPGHGPEQGPCCDAPRGARPSFSPEGGERRADRESRVRDREGVG